jgi:LacI family transcriptional regulator
MLYSRPKPGTFTILHIDEDISNSIHLNAKGSGFSEFIQERTQGEFKIVELSIAARESTFGSQLDTVFSDPTLQGVFVTTSRGTAVVAGYLQKHGKREIRMIGYDMLPENLKFLRTGIIDFLINQNPKRQAFLGISHLVNHLMFKKVAPEKDLFPLEVISQQNVESYIGSGIH